MQVTKQSISENLNGLLFQLNYKVRYFTTLLVSADLDMLVREGERRRRERKIGENESEEGQFVLNRLF